jgi:hypothetical protein
MNTSARRIFVSVVVDQMLPTPLEWNHKKLEKNPAAACPMINKMITAIAIAARTTVRRLGWNWMIGCGGTLKSFLSADRNENAAAARVHRRVRVTGREKGASDRRPGECVVVAVGALEIAVVDEPSHL